MNALTSIIIPCRNGMNYLAQAVAGIQRQNMPLEVIVVDDGSTDATASLAKELGCTVISIPHAGLPVARNAGLKQARGEYVLFHDHDDVMREHALEQLLAEFQQNPAAQIIMAKARDFISPELGEADKKVLALREEAYYGLLSGAVLIRREVFDAVEGFDESLATSPGIDFLTQAESAGICVKKADFIAVDRRLHNSNMGRTMQKQENKDHADILRRKLRRA